MRFDWSDRHPSRLHGLAGGKASWRRQIEDLAAEYGAIVEETRGNHLAIRHPEGWTVIAAATPSDHRSFLNTRAQVRRYARGGAPVRRPAKKSTRSNKPKKLGGYLGQEQFKCLGGSTRAADVSWDMVTVVGAVWGAYIGGRYARPITGAFLGTVAPIIAHWAIEAARDKKEPT